MSFSRAATIALAAVVGSAIAAPVATAATLDLLGVKLEIPLPDFSEEPPPAPTATPPAPAPVEPAPVTPPPAVAPAAPAPVATPAPAPAAPVTVTTARRAASKVRAQVAPVDVPPATDAPVVAPDPAATPVPAPVAPTPEVTPVSTLPAEIIPAPLADSDSGSGFLSLLGAMLIRMVAITVWLVAASFLVLTRRRGAVPAV